MRELRRPNRTDAVPTSQAMATVEEIKKAINPPPPMQAVAMIGTELEVRDLPQINIHPGDKNNGVHVFFNIIKLFRSLSAPDIEFLTIVIEKTNFGAISEVKIPRSDFKSASLHAEMLKATREKLEAYGYIRAMQKKSGPGSEAWHYSLVLEKFSGIMQ
ncbi:MAG: hypothetical protein WCG27_06105 [Pseudomonadota bacterium]